MNSFELAEEILLIITYTLLIVTLFLEYICYKRNLENPETIYFTAALLFLIINLSLTPIFVDSFLFKTAELFKQFSFILVAVTTPLNIFKERSIQLNPFLKKALIGFSLMLFVICVLNYFFVFSKLVEHVVTVFLGISVVGSMTVMLVSRPGKKFRHSGKTDKLFALAFIIIVPLSLGLNFIFAIPDLKIGITIPVIFILLSGNKLMDDVQRLSLLKPGIEPNPQLLDNYMLTEREKEIALLLIKGKTYKQISESLFISVPTVKTHSGNVYRKCGVNSRSELTALNFSFL